MLLFDQSVARHVGSNLSKMQTLTSVNRLSSSLLNRNGVWFEGLANWLHMGGSGKRMGDLVYKSEPSFYVRYFGRCGVTANRFMVLCAWTDVGRGFQSQLIRLCRQI